MKLSIKSPDILQNDQNTNEIINEYVIDTLSIIENDIHEVINNQLTFAHSEISSLILVPGMLKGCATLYVYYSILVTLDKKKYITQIELFSNFMCVTTKGLTSKDTRLEVKMKEYIKSKIKKT